MLIHEFHSMLAMHHDQSTLFKALSRLRSLSGVKAFAAAEGGWIVWTDATDPVDDGSSLRIATAMA
jgi:hypothetical protein